MKLPLIHLALCCLILPLAAQEESVGTPASGERVSIPVPVTAHTLPEPAPPPEIPNFKVVESQSRRLDVVETPPMPGLPPVTGTISISVRKVVDPKLPPLPEPLPALPPDDPAVQARLAEFLKNYKSTELVFVSGQTYNHSRSLIRVYPQGREKGSASCWSNLDLAHFSGFSTFRVTEDDGTFQDFGLLMAYSEHNTENMRIWMERVGHEYEEPEIPDLPDLEVSGPAFVMVKTELESEEAVATIRRMHELYKKEGPRMEAAYHERVLNYEAKKAFYLSNPPKPKDLVLNYWRGKRPEREGAEP